MRSKAYIEKLIWQADANLKDARKRMLDNSGKPRAYMAAKDGEAYWLRQIHLLEAEAKTTLLR